MAPPNLDPNFTLTAIISPADATVSKFKGWGTSLCWWANALGGKETTIRDDIADALFSPPPLGLGLTVVRYNIGGGDDVTCNHRVGIQPHHFRYGGDVPGWLANDDGSCARLAASTTSNENLCEGLDVQADMRQLWFLTAARQRGATVFEAFANSPPWWMTRSGCTAGYNNHSDTAHEHTSTEDSKNNLKEECVDQFAIYLVRVLVYISRELGIDFHTLSPMNEPNPGACAWRAGNIQEGCNFDVQMQQKVLKATHAALQKYGLATEVSACDETSTAMQIDTWLALDDQTQSCVAQLNTHTYTAIDRIVLHRVAKASQKRLWMSEMCYGGSNGKHDHQSMNAPLQLAENISLDLGTLKPECWVYWQAVEDEANAQNCGGNWGVIHADMSPEGQFSLERSDTHHRIWERTKKYWTMAQFTHFIRPESILLAVEGDGHDSAGRLADGVFITVAFVPHSNLEAPSNTGMSRWGVEDHLGCLVAVLTNQRLQDQTVVIDYATHGIASYSRNNNSSGYVNSSGPTSQAISLYRTSATEDLKNLCGSPTLMDSLVPQFDSCTGSHTGIRVHLTPESITTVILPMMSLAASASTMLHSISAAQNPQRHYNENSLSNGQFRIINVFSKLCLAITGSLNEQKSLVQSTYRNTNDQHWRFVESALSTALDPVFSLVNSKSAKLVDISGWNRDNGAQLILFGRTGQANQQWRVKEKEQQGIFSIHSTMHNKVLDVAGWNMGDGAQVVMWGDNGGDNQLWRLERV
ncbi:hypothetical protein BSLG_008623 [Batrachochytrium salamandrivorans]|nr:hypothetical protein BSLG_008623 [Batrachochytrium salamandrivorans]